MSAHPPTGSSDEIFIPLPGQSPTPRTGETQPGHAAAEEALRHALRARCGDLLPRWADVLAVARALARR